MQSATKNIHLGHHLFFTLVLFLSLFLVACSSAYVAPNAESGSTISIREQDINSSLVDLQIGEAQVGGAHTENENIAVAPTASFPVNIAFARIQPIRSNVRREQDCIGQGRFCLISNRYLETEESMQKLLALDDLRGIAPINQFLISDTEDTQEQLRNAASAVQAEMLLVYSVNTRSEIASHELGILGAAFLGYAPTKKALVNTTISAGLYDTSTGYVCALFEASASVDKRGNFWSIDSVTDSATREAESEAFHALIGNIEQRWPAFLAEYN